MVPAWAGEVLDYWLGLGREAWFKRSDELDAAIRERFLGLWQEQRQCPLEHFLGSPEQAAAAVILFDQFPRNMFRGSAESFATDHLALAITHAALDLGYDDKLGRDARSFLLMPLQHSERLADQERSLIEFARLGDEEGLRFARMHHEAIARFGGFPHRNPPLGRAPRAEEIAEQRDPQLALNRMLWPGK